MKVRKEPVLEKLCLCLSATRKEHLRFLLVLTEQHFTEVVGSEEFLNLGMEQVSSLIASDKLSIPTEEKVHTPLHTLVRQDVQMSV